MEIKKDKDDVYKINATIYTAEELKEIDNKLAIDLDNIVNQITENIYINREVILLQKVIKKQQKEIEQTKTKINKIVLMIRENYDSDFYDDYETISALRDDIYNLLTKNIGE